MLRVAGRSSKARLRPRRASSIAWVAVSRPWHLIPGLELVLGDRAELPRALRTLELAGRGGQRDAASSASRRAPSRCSLLAIRELPAGPRVGCCRVDCSRRSSLASSGESIVASTWPLHRIPRRDGQGHGTGHRRVQGRADRRDHAAGDRGDVTDQRAAGDLRDPQPVRVDRAVRARAGKAKPASSSAATTIAAIVAWRLREAGGAAMTRSVAEVSRIIAHCIPRPLAAAWCLAIAMHVPAPGQRQLTDPQGDFSRTFGRGGVRTGQRTLARTPAADSSASARATRLPALATLGGAAHPDQAWGRALPSTSRSSWSSA